MTMAMVITMTAGRSGQGGEILHWYSNLRAMSPILAEIAAKVHYFG